MIVVSDTSAITSLIQIGRAEILKDLFRRVLIPIAVRDELMVFHRELPSFLEIAPVHDLIAVGELLESLDRGEAEAIILAQEVLPDFLLVDDLAAREIASAKGLSIVGLLGVLAMGKRAGVVNSLSQTIANLETRAGFRISVELKQRVLKEAGEIDE